MKRFLLCALVMVPVVAWAQPADTPAIERAREVATLLGADEGGRFTDYVEQAYSPSFLERVPLDRQLQRLGYLRDRTHGVRLHTARPDGADRATVVLQSTLTGEWIEMGVTVEPAPPHRIMAMRFRPLGALPDGVPAPPPITETEALHDLRTFMDRLAAADYFSGVVLLARADSVLLHEAYGAASIEYDAPNRPSTRFNVASINKMFTAVAVLQLVEAGRLSLSDTIAAYLPDVPNPEAARRVRIEHLLSHTGGVGPDFQRRWGAADPAQMDDVDGWLELARDDTLAFAPGTRYAYSNAGYTILGAIIEQVTGQSYYDYVAAHVLAPAGMTRTGFFAADEVVPDRAQGYQKAFTEEGTTFQNTATWNPHRGGPAGGGYATAGDLFRFGRALQEGRLLRPASVDLLWSAKPDLGAEAYGFGLNVEPEPVVGHSGAMYGASTNLDLFLESGYTAVVLSNYGGVVAMPVVRHIRQLLFRIR